MDISRLCLGTVQFGLNYGINNKKGKPKMEEVYSMLDFAKENGIKILDTAEAYGNAEERIGEYIRKRNLRYEFKIISKLMPNLFDKDTDKVNLIVSQHVESSIKRLGVDILDGYLLHTPTDIYNEKVIEGLTDCKKRGLINNIGVSIYEIDHAIDAAKTGCIDYIQIPYNIFDQRAEKTEFYDLAKNNNVRVFARSPFLQGLFFMNYEEIPENLSEVKKYLHDLDEIISYYKITRLEAAILFSVANEKNDYVVFGVDSIVQLKQNIELFTKMDLYKECVSAIKTRFVNIDKSIIFPSLWANK